MSTDGWGEYLSAFHSENAGITQDVLSVASDAEGNTPYDWLASGWAPGRTAHIGGTPGGLVLAPGDVVVDRSLEELRGPTAVNADAARLPLSSGTFATVSFSMSLMLTTPLPAVLDEARRLLQTGGRLVAIVPGGAEVSPVRDLIRYGRLLAVMRTRLTYPNDDALTKAAVDAGGFRVDDDTTRRFTFECQPEVNERLVRSLYVPGVSDERIEKAVSVAHKWEGRLGIPIRRLVATAV